MKTDQELSALNRFDAEKLLTLAALKKELEQATSELSRHPVYQRLVDLEALHTFMKYHVYAVWDFMSLLKSLQREVTCVDLPWRPSRYSKSLVRLINEIVLGEESDLGPDGLPCDHFSLYLRAMEEVGLETSLVIERTSTLNFEGLPTEVREFVSYNLELALSGGAHEVCAAFFFGRENIIPDLFRPALEVVSQSIGQCESFKFYLDRHIELDGDEHGPLAHNCLMEIVGNNELKLREAYLVGLHSLRLRKNLWDGALKSIDGRASVSL